MTRMRPLALLCLLVLAPMAWAQGDSTPAEREVEELVAKIALQVCDTEKPLCEHLNAFISGSLPQFKDGETFYAGRFVVFDTAGEVRARDYLGLFTRSSEGSVMARVLPIYPENQEETEQAEMYLAQRARGVADDANLFHKYLQQESRNSRYSKLSSSQRSLLLKQDERRPAYLRGGEDVVYVLVLGFGPDERGVLFGYVQ